MMRDIVALGYVQVDGVHWHQSWLNDGAVALLWNARVIA